MSLDHQSSKKVKGQRPRSVERNPEFLMHFNLERWGVGGRMNESDWDWVVGEQGRENQENEHLEAMWRPCFKEKGMIHYVSTPGKTTMVGTQTNPSFDLTIQRLLMTFIQLVLVEMGREIPNGVCPRKNRMWWRRIIRWGRKFKRNWKMEKLWE